MVEQSPVITEDDIAGLNRRALIRVIDVARRGSTALLVLGGVLALAWAWQTLRAQGFISDGPDDGFGIGFVGENLTVKQRVDAFVGMISALGFAGIVAGLGLGLRVYCEAAALRAGDSLTGWKVGDRIDDGDDTAATTGPEPVDLDPA